MSSLDHDRLLEERPKASRAAASPGTATEVPKPRRSPRSSQEKAEGERPRRAARSAAPAKPAASKPAAAKSPAAKPAAAKATPSRKTAAPAQKSVAKAAPAKAAATPTSAARTASATRPSPVKRAPVTAPPAEPAGSPTPVAVLPAEPSVSPPPVTSTAVRTRAGVRRRLGLNSAPRRRPGFLLAAALVGALSVGLSSAGSDHAQASASRPVSVAHVLGVTANHSSAPSAAAELRMVAASRAQREAEQTAAAQAQNAADQAAIEAARPKAVMPVNGAVLTTCFCMRWGTMHWGIDLAAPLGTPEYAAMDGVVVKAGPASGFGQAVYIQHANGDVTVYGHMEKILVTTGQVVHAGDTIALLGEEGESTGPHLHFEVHVGGIQGQKIDPIPWLRDRGVQI